MAILKTTLWFSLTLLYLTVTKCEDVQTNNETTQSEEVSNSNSSDSALSTSEGNQPTLEYAETGPPGGVVREIHFRLEDDSEISPRGLLEFVLFFQSCTCDYVSCKCCLSLDLFKQKPFCLILKYLKDESAVRGSVLYGEKDLISFVTSASTQSKENIPSCFKLKESSSINMCFQFYGIRWDMKTKTLNMCSTFELNVWKTNQFKTDFGCFEMGVGKAIAKVYKFLRPKSELVRFKMTSEESKTSTQCFLASERGEMTKSCSK